MKRNLLLIIIAALIVVLPLALRQNSDFNGADGQAESVINEVAPDYKPWYSSVWEPPSGEVESLLFALQAAAGAGFIGYYAGYMKGKKVNSGQGKCND